VWTQQVFFLSISQNILVYTSEHSLVSEIFKLKSIKNCFCVNLVKMSYCFRFSSFSFNKTLLLLIIWSIASETNYFPPQISFLDINYFLPQISFLDTNYFLPQISFLDTNYFLPQISFLDTNYFLPQISFLKYSQG
jgi:hypothetical protein